MEQHSRDVSSGSSEFLGAGWFDPIELAIRDRVRGFIEELVDAELDEALGRSRYRRRMPAVMACGTAGYRHGRRDRQLLGSFGPVTISVPRARLNKADEEPGMAQRSAVTLCADDEADRGGDRWSLSVRHQHPPGAAGTWSKGAVGKDVVSRTWRRSCLAFGATGRRCCWRCATWAARARRPGAVCSMNHRFRVPPHGLRGERHDELPTPPPTGSRACPPRHRSARRKVAREVGVGNGTVSRIKAALR